MMEDQGAAGTNLRAEYSEVCSNFRLLTDIRFKLLALLPIGTAAGVALTVNAQSSIGRPLVGLFGLAVTSSAALYNLRNDQLYNELVARAAHLERLLNLKEGAFSQRPRVWRRVGPFSVTHGQIWWIYLSSLAAWLFLILHGLNAPWSSIVSGAPRELMEAVCALALAFLAALCAYAQGETTSRRLKRAAKEAVSALRQIPLSSSPQDHYCWKGLLHWTSVLAGGKKNVEKSLLFYLERSAEIYWDRPADGQICDVHAAAQLLSVVTDMPSRWIFDVVSGRRG